MFQSLVSTSQQAISRARGYYYKVREIGPLQQAFDTSGLGKCYYYKACLKTKEKNRQLESGIDRALGGPGIPFRYSIRNV